MSIYIYKRINIYRPVYLWLLSCNPDAQQNWQNIRSCNRIENSELVEHKKLGTQTRGILTNGIYQYKLKICLKGDENFAVASLYIDKSVIWITAFSFIHQIRMSSLLNDFSILNHSNGIYILNGSQSMSDHNTRSPHHDSVQCFLNDLLRLAVQCARCLVQE